MLRLSEKVQLKNNKFSKKSTLRKNPKKEKKKTAKMKKGTLKGTRKPIRARERRNMSQNKKTHKTSFEEARIRKKSCLKSADNPTRLYQATRNPE
jgi:hypothetical protein